MPKMTLSRVLGKTQIPFKTIMRLDVKRRMVVRVPAGVVVVSFDVLPLEFGGEKTELSKGEEVLGQSRPLRFLSQPVTLLGRVVEHLIDLEFGR